MPPKEKLLGKRKERETILRKEKYEAKRRFENMPREYAEPSQDEDESYRESQPSSNPEDQNYAQEELRRAKEFEADTQMSEESDTEFNAETQETPSSPVFNMPEYEPPPPSPEMPTTGKRGRERSPSPVTSKFTRTGSIMSHPGTTRMEPPLNEPEDTEWKTKASDKQKKKTKKSRRDDKEKENEVPFNYPEDNRTLESWHAMIEGLAALMPTWATALSGVYNQFYDADLQWRRERTIEDFYKEIKKMFEKTTALEEYIGVKDMTQWSDDVELDRALQFAWLILSIEDTQKTKDSPIVSIGRFEGEFKRWHLIWWKKLAADLLNMRSIAFATLYLGIEICEKLEKAVQEYCGLYAPDIGEALKKSQTKEKLKLQFQYLKISYKTFSSFKDQYQKYRREWMQKYLFDSWEVPLSLFSLLKQLKEMTSVRTKIENVLQTQHDMFVNVVLNESPLKMFFTLGRPVGTFKNNTDFNRPMKITVGAQVKFHAVVRDSLGRSTGKFYTKTYPALGKDEVQQYDAPFGADDPSNTFDTYSLCIETIERFKVVYAKGKTAWGVVWDLDLREILSEEPQIEDLVEDEDPEEFNERVQEESEYSADQENDGVGECKLPLYIQPGTPNWEHRPLSIDEIRSLLTEHYQLEDVEKWEHKQFIPPSDDTVWHETRANGTTRQVVYKISEDILVEPSIVRNDPIPTVAYRVRIPMRAAVTEAECIEARKLPFIVGYGKAPVFGWNNQWQQRWCLYATMAKAPKNHMLHYLFMNSGEELVIRPGVKQFIITINPNNNERSLLGTNRFSAQSLRERCQDILSSLDYSMLLEEHSAIAPDFTAKNILRYSLLYQTQEVAPESGKIHYHGLIQFTYMYAQSGEDVLNEYYDRPELKLNYRYLKNLLAQYFGDSVYVNFQPVTRKLLDPEKDQADFEARWKAYIAKQREAASVEQVAANSLYTGAISKGTKKVINKGGKRHRKRTVPASSH